MFNHHSSGAAQVLSGRAAPGGAMKVLAGPLGIAAGEQVLIQYGGGVIGSERFLQDYGFLDPRASAAADAGFVQHVLGAEGAAALAATTAEEDRALLQGRLSECGRLAVAFRLALKEAQRAGVAADGAGPQRVPGL